MKLHVPEYPERFREKPKYELNPSSRAMVSFNSSPININLIYFNYIGLKVGYFSVSCSSASFYSMKYLLVTLVSWRHTISAFTVFRAVFQLPTAARERMPLIFHVSIRILKSYPFSKCCISKRCSTPIYFESSFKVCTLTALIIWRDWAILLYNQYKGWEMS